jgi:hypothetical protein
MQHREWNPKAFFKKVSPELMARYEALRGIALVRDPARPPADRTYHARKQLPEPRRLALDAELLPINDMCSTHARPYLDGLARSVWGIECPHLIEESRDWSVHDLAMRLFIEAPQAFVHAHQNYAVDMMDHFREYRGKRRVTLNASSSAKETMRRAMVEHFRRNAGGARCQVEDHNRPDKFALFIYHENELTPVDAFDDNGLVVPEWCRPVVHIAAVYYPDSCTLLVKAPRKAEREKLRDLFGEIFVGEPDFFEDLTKSPKFSFVPLADSNFNFPTHPADGILGASITRLILRPGHADVRRLALDFEPRLTPAAIRWALADHGVVLDGRLIDGMRLQFEFAEGKGRARFRTVSLHNPNSTNLTDTLRDRTIRRYLKEWRIDESRSAFAMATAPLEAARGP